ncbi:MAG: T9SS type A sorting domain-containing protein [Cytophagales bacterium]|nr:T9SS type A sorting domain-containing protein [Cytophagales bacterium]
MKKIFLGLGLGFFISLFCSSHLGAQTSSEFRFVIQSPYTQLEKKGERNYIPIFEEIYVFSNVQATPQNPKYLGRFEPSSGNSTDFIYEILFGDVNGLFVLGNNSSDANRLYLAKPFEEDTPSRMAIHLVTINKTTRKESRVQVIVNQKKINTNDTGARVVIFPISGNYQQLRSPLYLHHLNPRPREGEGGPFRGYFPMVAPGEMTSMVYDLGEPAGARSGSEPTPPTGISTPVWGHEPLQVEASVGGLCVICLREADGSFGSLVSPSETITTTSSSGRKFTRTDRKKYPFLDSSGRPILEDVHGSDTEWNGLFAYPVALVQDASGNVRGFERWDDARHGSAKRCYHVNLTLDPLDGSTSSFFQLDKMVSTNQSFRVQLKDFHGVGSSGNDLVFSNPQPFLFRFIRPKDDQFHAKRNDLLVKRYQDYKLEADVDDEGNPVLDDEGNPILRKVVDDEGGLVLVDEERAIRTKRLSSSGPGLGLVRFSSALEKGDFENSEVHLPFRQTTSVVFFVDEFPISANTILGTLHQPRPGEEYPSFLLRPRNSISGLGSSGPRGDFVEIFSSAEITSSGATLEFEVHYPGGVFYAERPTILQIQVKAISNPRLVGMNLVVQPSYQFSEQIDRNPIRTPILYDDSIPIILRGGASFSDTASGLIGELSSYGLRFPNTQPSYRITSVNPLGLSIGGPLGNQLHVVKDVPASGTYDIEIQSSFPGVNGISRSFSFQVLPPKVFGGSEDPPHFRHPELNRAYSSDGISLSIPKGTYNRGIILATYPLQSQDGLELIYELSTPNGDIPDFLYLDGNFLKTSGKAVNTAATYRIESSVQVTNYSEIIRIPGHPFVLRVLDRPKSLGLLSSFIRGSGAGQGAERLLYTSDRELLLSEDLDPNTEIEIGILSFHGLYFLGDSRIQSGNARDAQGEDIFSLQNRRLLLTGSLDFERSSTHTLIIEKPARGTSGAESLQVNITVLDIEEAPTDLVLTSHYKEADGSLLLPEAKGEDFIIGTLSATDNFRTLSGGLLYTIDEGDGTDAKEKFKILGTTLSTSSIPLDVSTRSSHTLVIRARARRGPKGKSVQLRIPIRVRANTPPTDINLEIEGVYTRADGRGTVNADYGSSQKIFIPENLFGTPIHPLVVGSLSAEDTEDIYFSYHIVESDPSTSLFGIGGSENDKLILSGNLDHETEDTYNLTLEVRDGSPSGTYKEKFQIQISDIDEPPSGLAFTPSQGLAVVGEENTIQLRIHTKEGVEVGTVSATDPESLPVQFSLISSDPILRVEGSKILSTSYPLSLGPPYDVNIQAHTGVGTPSATLPIRILVQDEESPTKINLRIASGFTQGGTQSALYVSSSEELYISENTTSTPTAPSLGQLSTLDTDDNSFVYAILKGNLGSVFSIGGTQKNELLFSGALDYESQTEYAILLQSCPENSLDCIQSIFKVHVKDVDEPPDNFSFYAEPTHGGKKGEFDVGLPRTISAQTVLGSFKARNNYPSGGGNLRYRLENTSTLFTVEGNKIRISDDGSFDSESPDNYTLSLIIDTGDETQSSTQSLKLHLSSTPSPGNIRLNIKAAFTQADGSGTVDAVYGSSQEIYLSEDTAVSSGNPVTLGTLSSTDGSSGFTYVLEGDDIFNLSGTSVQLIRPADYEKNSSHILTIEITNTNTQRYYKEDFNIHVQDVDEPPLLSASIRRAFSNSDPSIHISFRSTQAKVLELADLEATDPEGQSVVFTITSPTDPLNSEEYFSLSTDGILKTSGSLNLPSGSYTIGLSANTGSNTAVASLNLQVQIIDNQTPTDIVLLIEGNFTAADATSTSESKKYKEGSQGLYVPEKLSASAQAPIILGSLSSVDGDDGRGFSYALVETYPFLSLGGTYQNELHLINPLNYNLAIQHDFTIRTTDSQNASFEKTFEIQVVDIPEAPTDLSLKPATNFGTQDNSLFLKVGTFPGIQMGTFQATNNYPSGGDLVYQITGGDDSLNKFEINGNMLQTSINLSTLAKTYTLEIEAYSSNIQKTPELIASLSVSITVQPNKPPHDIKLNIKGVYTQSDGTGSTDAVYTPGVQEIYIKEDAFTTTDIVIGQLSTLDVDDNQFTYLLSLSNNVGGLFAVSEIGELSLINTLDYELDKRYTLNVFSSDPDRASVSRSFVLHVVDVDEAPTRFAFNTKEGYGGIPAENISARVSLKTEDNFSIGEFSAQTNWSGGSLRYRLTRDQASPHTGRFAISGSELQTTATRIQKGDPDYRLGITVDTGDGTLSSVHEIIIRVVPSQPPLDINLLLLPLFARTTAATLYHKDSQHIYVLESADAATGPIDLGTLSTQDIDSQIHSYSFLNNSDVNSTFKLLQENGNTVLYLNKNLNYEEKDTYVLELRSEDEANEYVERDFILHVLDADEPPTGLSFVPFSKFEVSGTEHTATIPESKRRIMQIGEFSATNNYSVGNSILRFVLKGGDDPGDQAKFSIQGNQLLTTKIPLSRDIKTNYTLSIQVDTGENTEFNTLSVNIIVSRNIPPSDIDLSIQAMYTSERQDASAALDYAEGTQEIYLLEGELVQPLVIGSLSAEDEDDSSFTYQIVGGNEGDFFDIFERIENGFLVEHQLRQVDDLDRETTALHTLMIEVSDGGGETRTESFKIHVIDVNEPPLIAFTVAEDFQTPNSDVVSVTEGTPPDLLLGTLSARDPEKLPISLEITSGDDAQGFEKFQLSGDQNLELKTTNNPLERTANKEEYLLNITASTGDVGDSSSINIRIRISRNLPPTDLLLLIKQAFTGGHPSDRNYEDIRGVVHLKEDSYKSEPVLIGTLSSVDSDSKYFTYTLAQEGNEGEWFAISGEEKNELYLVKTLVQGKRRYDVKITSTDTFGRGNFARVFTIEVAKPNASPKDLSITPNGPISIPQSSEKGTEIGVLSAKDPDGDIIKYSILSGNEEELFELLQNIVLLRREASEAERSEYILRFLAEDGNGGNSSLDVNILILSETKDPKNSEGPMSLSRRNLSRLVYPNPVKDFLHLNEEYESLQIIDLLGKTHVSVKKERSVYVGFLPAGIYWLRIFPGGGKTSYLSRFAKD